MAIVVQSLAEAFLPPVERVLSTSEFLTRKDTLEAIGEWVVGSGITRIVIRKLAC